MKLNFWQWLGVVLLVVAAGLWINRTLQDRKQAEMGQPAPGFTEPTQEEEATTEPAGASPATAPG